QAFIDRLDKVLRRQFGGCRLRQMAAPGKVFQSFNCQIRIHCARAKSEQEREVHHFAGLARLHDQSNLSARFFPDQQIVNGCQRQQTRNRRIVLIHAAIGQNQHTVSRCNRQRSPLTQFVQRALESSLSVGGAEQSEERDCKQISTRHSSQFL